MDLAWETAKIYVRESLRYKWQFFSLWIMLPFPVIAQGIVYPLVYAAIIDRMTEFAGGAAITRGDILSLFWWLLTIEAVHFVMWRIIDYTMVFHQPKVMRNLDRKVFSWFMQLSYTFHVNSFGGSLVARGRRFVNSYERIFDTFYFEVVPMFIRLVFILVVLFIEAPLIAFILLTWMIVFMVSQVYLTIKKMPLSRDAAEAESAVTANLADTITNISSVKSFGRDEFEGQRFAKTTGNQYVKRLRSWRRDISIRTFQAFAMALASLVVLYFSIDLLFEGIITLGIVVLIGVYVRQAFNDLWSFGRVIQRIERSFSDAAEMTRTFKEDIEVKDHEQPAKPNIKDGKIEIKNLSFKHKDAGSDEILFKDFSLSIKPGTKVGLVGPSGGGKTTITRLLLRLYDPDEGSVLIDGHDIRELAQSDLRANIAYVPQEPVLFHRSLADNIRYGKPAASLKEIKKAGREARADQFIAKLPKKYDTLVGERGTKLSGGEKQRVAVARAMIKNAPILVMDEATSALDSESERLIQQAMKKLMEDKTAIVIAHRLSTIQNMDRIVVLDGGRIVEDGTHKELLEKGGLYAELWSHQSGGFIED